jgi:predicted dehydrogenase
MRDDRIITIDPAHFHAALIHKEMLPGVSPAVHIFAPFGPDLNAHLDRLLDFNKRAERPTSWEPKVSAGPDYLTAALRKPQGNIVVLAGRNHTKIDTMLACVQSGLHVLADKPWIIRDADFPKLEALIAAAEKRGVVVFDVMTERHEITSILQRELIHDGDIFGKLIFGSSAVPAVIMESVHALKKQVAGVPLRRPVEFFDIYRQGEGLTDVGTHLVDLAAWLIAPGESLDFRNDVEMISADRWPTTISRADFRQITGEEEFPTEFAGNARGEAFAYYCNNLIRYTVRGHHVRLDIRWDMELPAGDTHNAYCHGTRSRVEIRQASDRPGPPELFVITDHDGALPALKEKIASWRQKTPGFDLEEQDGAYRVVIPKRLRVGHEAHFAQVTAEFLTYVRREAKMPAWEVANQLAKYFVTTQGVELARRTQSMIS